MDYQWEILGKVEGLREALSQGKQKSKVKSEEIIKALLRNRGLTTPQAMKEFFKPTSPKKIPLYQFGLSKKEINKAITCLKKAKKFKEQVIIYGDYDADGICATAVLWEGLHSLGLNVLPYIPVRFSEGYGLNIESIQNVKTQFPKVKLIITVDNGIVSHQAVSQAKKMGIDVIVTDHHRKGKFLPKAKAIIYTTEVSGVAIAWIFVREIKKQFPISHSQFAIKDGLDLVAIGTIADQIPLLGANRSFVKYGLKVLNETKRPGLLALFQEAGLNKVRNLDSSGEIGTYEVGFIIAPRINAMGRLEQAIDSLRLLCTLDKTRAEKLAYTLGKTNQERQKIVDEVVLHSRSQAQKRQWKGVIVVSHQSYHEGVIGLAASKLVEEFYRPAIVISQGEKVSKASARSIAGFNIIETIHQLDDLLLEGGGHPMAAGFSIESRKIEKFCDKLEELSSKLLTDELLLKKLKIDLRINFTHLSKSLLKAVSSFEPTGIGNPTPVFATKKVKILDVRLVGFDNQHLKMILEKDGQLFEAIAFNFGAMYGKLINQPLADVAFSFEENVWQGQKRMQLKIKDIKFCHQ